MRIAYVFMDMPGYVGGPSIHAQRLLPASAPRGHDVVPLILHHRGGSPAADKLRRLGLRPQMALAPFRPKHHIAWTLSQIIDINPDVYVHQRLRR